MGRGIAMCSLLLTAQNRSQPLNINRYFPPCDIRNFLQIWTLRWNIRLLISNYNEWIDFSFLIWNLQISQIGFNAGNGTQAYEYKPYSQASVLRDLTGRGWANGFPGRHIFRIDERIMLGTCNKDIGTELTMQQQNFFFVITKFFFSNTHRRCSLTFGVRSWIGKHVRWNCC